MTLRYAILVGIGSLVFVVPGGAQSDRFVQMGTWKCPTKPRQVGFPPETVCDAVQFPTPFGGAPAVVVAFSTIKTAPDIYAFSVSATKITANGFVPEIVEEMPQGGGAIGTSYSRIPSSHTYEGTWVATGPNPPSHVVVIPKYVVLTVAYAPPGTNGGKTASSVSYGVGSSAGVTTSSINSFKQSYSVAFEGGILGGSLGADFSYGRSESHNESMEIKKSTSSTLEVPGPSDRDGIDHDRDRIYLWLNPTIDLSLTSSTVAWSLTGTGGLPQWVEVGWLNGHIKPIPPGTLSALKAAGITEADFPDILLRDPLAIGTPNFDATRFLSLTVIPYEPADSPTSSGPTQTYGITQAVTSTNGTGSQDTYAVGVSVKSIDLAIVNVSFKKSQTWEWTNSSSRSLANGSTESATVKMGGPAYGYGGPTNIEVFWDTVYRTFAFRELPPSSVALKGTLVTTAGKSLAWSEVSVSAGATTRRTFTNAKGEFTFFGNLIGPLTLQAKGGSMTLSETDRQRGGVTFRVRPD